MGSAAQVAARSARESGRIPELVFDMVLNLVYVKGIIDISLGRRADWHHLTPAPVPVTGTVQ